MKKKRPPTQRVPSPNPSPADPSREDAEWQAATDIVAEACRSFAHVLPPAQLAAYAAELRAYFFADPEGRALLRRTLEDPGVTASDDVARTAPADATRSPSANKSNKKAAG